MLREYVDPASDDCGKNGSLGWVDRGEAKTFGNLFRKGRQLSRKVFLHTYIYISILIRIVRIKGEGSTGILPNMARTSSQYGYH